jgi:PilZ domain-containing protein
MVTETFRLKNVFQAANNSLESDRSPRRAAALEGFGLLHDGKTFPLKVVDLSYDGCRIETAIALLPGVKLKMSVMGFGGAVDAAVRWCRNGSAGLKFNPDDLLEKSEKPRYCERIEVAAELSLRRLGRQHYRARLFDLSPKGCKVEFIERPRPGDTIWAKFDGIDPIESITRWMDGFYGGLEFVRPIYPAVFDLMIARLMLDGASPSLS